MDCNKIKPVLNSMPVIPPDFRDRICCVHLENFQQYLTCIHTVTHPTITVNQDRYMFSRG